MTDTIRLSGKEVSGLAARVLASAFMPAGAVGAAAEAIEFLELIGADGLRRLDGETEQLLDMPWQPPAIVAEGPGHAVLDAGRTSALFHCAVLADFLVAAVADSGGRAAAVVRGGKMHRYLGTVPYFLSSRGLTGLVVELADGKAALSTSETHGPSWRYVRLADVRADSIILPGGYTLDMAEGASALLLAFAESPGDLRAFSMQTPRRFETTSDEYARRKSRILKEGWPVDAGLWSSLMCFADRSLVKTSDRSRLGAG